MPFLDIHLLQCNFEMLFGKVCLILKKVDTFRDKINV